MAQQWGGLVGDDASQAFAHGRIDATAYANLVDAKRQTTGLADSRQPCREPGNFVVGTGECKAIDRKPFFPAAAVALGATDSARDANIGVYVSSRHDLRTGRATPILIGRL